MAGRAYGTVAKAGRATMNSGRMNRHGPSHKNVKATRKSQAHPNKMVRRLTSPIKGSDKGMG